MKAVIEAQQQLATSKQRLHDAVTAARDQGHTWQEIGDALNMTRQAAFKRFGKPSKPTTENVLAPRPVKPILGIAEHAFELVARADYDALHALMTPETATALSAGLIAKTWTDVLGDVGELEACHDTHAELPDGTVLDPDERVLGVTVAATTLRCEAGEMRGRVAFNDDRKIVGILIVPANHGKLPF